MVPRAAGAGASLRGGGHGVDTLGTARLDIKQAGALRASYSEGPIYALTTTEPTIVPVLAVLWLDE